MFKYCCSLIRVVSRGRKPRATCSMLPPAYNLAAFTDDQHYTVNKIACHDLYRFCLPQQCSICVCTRARGILIAEDPRALALPAISIDFLPGPQKTLTAEDSYTLAVPVSAVVIIHSHANIPAGMYARGAVNWVAQTPRVGRRPDTWKEL